MTDPESIPDELPEDARAMVAELRELYEPHKTKGEKLERVKHLAKKLIDGKYGVTIQSLSRMIPCHRQTVERWVGEPSKKGSGKPRKATLSKRDRKRIEEGKEEEVVDDKVKEELMQWQIGDETAEVAERYKARIAFCKRLEERFKLIVAREGAGFIDYVENSITFFEERSARLILERDEAVKVVRAQKQKLTQFQNTINEMAKESYDNAIKLDELRSLLVPGALPGGT